MTRARLKRVLPPLAALALSASACSQATGGGQTSCVGEGRPCTGGAACCQGLSCDPATGACAVPACSGVGASCANGESCCCWTTCTNGTCAFGAPASCTCIPLGEQCLDGSQCCGGASCVPDAGGTPRCNACKPDGEYCLANADCCSGTCDPEMMLCAGCKRERASCSGLGDASCCPGTSCTFSELFGWACRSPYFCGGYGCCMWGMPCRLSVECCAGLSCVMAAGATSGTCTCTENGGHCTDGADCCTGVCDPATGTCKDPVIPICTPLGGTCAATGDCCVGSCVKLGSATSGTCTNTNVCVPLAGPCRANRDCCSGECYVPRHAKSGLCTALP